MNYRKLTFFGSVMYIIHTHVHTNIHTQHNKPLQTDYLNIVMGHKKTIRDK